MENEKQSVINPLPGHFLALIEDSQMANVNFKGDDKFDLPQTGTLIRLAQDDEDVNFDSSQTYKSLIGRRVMWAKYAESDCLIYDSNLQKDVVLISLGKLRGYE